MFNVMTCSQLRDLVICPEERGVVNFIQEDAIMERDVTNPTAVSTISEDSRVLSGMPLSPIAHQPAAQYRYRTSRRTLTLGDAGLW